MTRINTIDPAILPDQHLIAEYRELPRVASALKKSLKKTSVEKLNHGFLKGGYCLGTGHVKFFYPLGKFLFDRYDSLIGEMENRGFAYAQDRYIDWEIFQKTNNFFRDWEPSIRCHQKNIERLMEKIEQKNPPWYRFHGEVKSVEFWHDTYKEFIEKERGLLNANL